MRERCISTRSRPKCPYHHPPYHLLLIHQHSQAGPALIQLFTQIHIPIIHHAQRRLFHHSSPRGSQRLNGCQSNRATNYPKPQRPQWLSSRLRHCESFSYVYFPPQLRLAQTSFPKPSSPSTARLGTDRPTKRLHHRRQRLQSPNTSLPQHRRTRSVARRRLCSGHGRTWAQRLYRLRDVLQHHLIGHPVLRPQRPRLRVSISRPYIHTYIFIPCPPPLPFFCNAD